MKKLAIITLLLLLLCAPHASALSDASGEYSGKSDQAARQGDWPQAEALMQQALMHDPSSDSYFLRLAEIKARRGNVAEARAMLDDFEKKNPSSALLQCKKAVLLTIAGDYAAALALAGKPQTQQSEGGCIIRLETAEALWSAGKRSEALALLDASKVDEGQRAAIQDARLRFAGEMFEEGRRHLSAGEDDKALAVWSTLSEADPTNRNLAALLCAGEHERRTLQSLSDMLRARLTACKADSSAAMAAAYAWRCIGDMAQARAALDAADAAHKLRPEWLAENAALEIQSGATAPDDVLNALNISALSADDWLLLSQAAERARGGEAALALVRRALEVSTDRRLFIEMERIYSMHADLPFDSGWLARMEELYPDDLRMLQLIGQAYFMREQNERALPYLERVFKADPHGSGLLGMIAAAFHDLPDKDTVIPALEERLRRDPGDTAARMALGVIAYYNENYARALELIEPLQSEFPEEPRVWIYSMMAHFHLGRQAEAERLLKRALPLNDADVHYCASVIYEKNDPRRAVAEIDRFLSMSEYLPQRHISKIERVREHRRELLARIENGGSTSQGAEGADWRILALESLGAVALFLLMLTAVGRLRRK